MKLRPYQSAAIEATYDFCRKTKGDNPCIVIPTGGGKTPIMAQIARDVVTQWRGRIVILAHVKELLQQTAKTIQTMTPDLPIGIYSAGLGAKEAGYPITIAGIQSIYRKPEALRPTLIMIDEAHLIPPDGEGMYRTFLAAHPQARLIGLTATPYRTSSGYLCGPENILNAISYEIGVKELINDGFLSPLRSKAGRRKADTGTLHVRGGEFIAQEIADLMDQDELVETACREIHEHTKDRNAVLVFASGIDHALHVADVLQGHTDSIVGTIFGHTHARDRAEAIEMFKAGDMKYLINVDVLTTGFDAPNVDCIAMLRPTMSPGLYYQMVGRGFRICEGKQDCLVLDFGGNVLRHGPVDAITPASIEATASGKGEAPAKECPECFELIHASYSTCPACGFEFPPREARHTATAGDDPVLSETYVDTFEVISTSYAVHTKRGADEDHPKTMRVDYDTGGIYPESEWVCPEHVGFARKKFQTWWTLRSHAPCPRTAIEAVELAEAGALSEALTVTVTRQSNEKYGRITATTVGPVPALTGEMIPF